MNAIIFTLIYFIPTIAAYAGKHHNRVPVFVINFFLGWTFIGWVVALAMASTSKKEVVNGR